MIVSGSVYTLDFRYNMLSPGFVVPHPLGETARWWMTRLWTGFQPGFDLQVGPCCTEVRRCPPMPTSGGARRSMQWLGWYDEMRSAAHAQCGGVKQGNLTR